MSTDNDATTKDPQSSQETASFLKRLAGPSTTKAGLAKDQTEINRIIAEASKGSKFYENEKRKDKELTERIERILAYRDDMLREANLERLQASVDHLLLEIEAERDLSQFIVHVDMDAFYANVELLHNPSLAGKPFGVGHGVLTTASYDARKFGVRSGMAGFIAKKLCPELILVKNHFSRYSEMSKQVMDIFRRYDPNLCPAGADEAYINVTAYCEEHGLEAGACVEQMRAAVHEETKLTVSAGIAPNKMLAKICSDKNKPNGQFQLPFERKAIMDFMHELSIRKVPGVGRVNERLLDSIGVKTCGDIYQHRATISLLDKQLGLRFLLRSYLGISSNVVQPYAREERKSIGAERTFNALSSTELILKKLREVAEELESDMKSTGWAGRTITLKYKLDTYQVFSRAKSCSRWITTQDDLYAIGKELLTPELPLTLRLIGLRATKLKDLRAPEPKSGIKRFFESTTSPRKKQKIEHNPDAEPKLEFEADDEPEDDAMPGFHEHELEEQDMHEEMEEEITLSQLHGADDEDNDHTEPTSRILDGFTKATPSRPHPPSSRSRPGPDSTSRPPKPISTAGSSRPKPISPMSSNKPSPRAAASTPRSDGKPHTVGTASSSRPRQAPPGSKSQSAVATARTRTRPQTRPQPRAAPCETHTCPICSREIYTDNNGLNEHVDFCLSRSAIKAASSSAG